MAPAPSLNPIRRQVETISQEMNAPIQAIQPQSQASSMEAMILAEDEPLAMEEELPEVIPAAMQAPMRPVMQPQPEVQPKRRFGLFGPRKEKKPEPQRVEPALAPRQSASAVRATSQVMSRTQADSRVVPQATGSARLVV